MINRREFIGKAAGALAAASTLTSGDPISALEKMRPVPPSDQVNLGIIGPGSRGQSDMRAFLRVPGVRIVGLCDIYEPRFDQARKITGENTPAFKDYRQLLDQKGLDAIIVATPPCLHEEHVVATVGSGRPVYAEKDMALTVDACDRIVAAVKRSGKSYQIGTQYHYAPWYQEALRRIHSGKLGQVTHIYAYWHRNASWRRPVPDPNDPKLEKLINWRLYRECSGGLLAELGTHESNFVNHAFDAIPESVMGMGDIVYWKDGREVPDNVQVVFRYPGGRTFSFSSITTNRFEGEQIRVYGTGGTLVLTQAGGMAYYEPAVENSAVPQELIVEHGVTTGASFRAEVPYSGAGEALVVPDGLEGNADYLACKSFIDCLQNNKRPEADERAGWASGVTIALGNMAINTGQRVNFADHVKPLAS
jgi:predicted dehydrogenase